MVKAGSRRVMMAQDRGSELAYLDGIRTVITEERYRTENMIVRAST